MYMQELTMPLLVMVKVTMLAEVRAELEKTLRWMKLWLMRLQRRRLRLMWPKLPASLKLRTRLSCECVLLRLYLGG
jgi:hypothetical protein